MRARHKIPTLFSVWMLDVFACALGGVSFLWILKNQEATQAQADLVQAASQTDTVAQQLADARAEAKAIAAQRDQTADELKTALARIADESATVARLRTQVSDTDDRLARKQREADELEKSVKVSKERAADLARLLREKETQATAASRKVDDLERLLREKDTLQTAADRKADDLAGKLAAAEGKLKDSRAAADEVPDLKAGMRKADAGRLAAEARAQTLEKLLAKEQKDLADARRSVVDLQGSKRTLADQLDRVRAAADNRFAGINLTGKRVVFLVDMSGSMDLIDDRTPDPTKWQGVRETVAKIMQSLPDLEKYQVILFSEKASGLFGNPDRWIEFSRTATVDQVKRALAATKPRGNTNMYAAFEAAFALRDQGLDTIYLFSDGLPNVGTPLTAAELQKLTELKASELLAKHVRTTLKTTWNRKQLGKERVKINALGFFYESPDVGAFLWALARENDGSFVGMSKP